MNPLISLEVKPILLILVKITIFSLMLAIGIALSFEKMLSLWRKPALLFRALLAVVVLVPLLVFLLLKLFNLPPEVMAGLAFLAASPLAYLILGAVLGVLYSIGRKRKLEKL